MVVNRKLFWIFVIYYFNSIASQKTKTAKNSRKSVVMHNLLSGVDEDELLEDKDIFDSLHEPWNSYEKQPKFEITKDNEKFLLWTMSAGELVHMIHPTIYNRLQAPGQINGKTTLVEVAVYIESMSTFRAQSMDFEVDMYLMLAWTDFRLQHNFSHPILLTDLQISNRMWQPDLYFVNSKFSYMHRVTTPNFMVLVYPDGYVMKSMRIDVTLACMLDLHNFPLDKQNCSAVIQSYAFVQSVVNLSWHHGTGYPINFNPDIKVNDMHRDNHVTENCDSAYPMFRGEGTWSCLKVIIMMRRRLDFHIFQIFIPAGMLVLISWLSFWLDIRASPARISLTITTLLTLTTISNGSRQELPHVPYMKANDVWFTVCQGFVFSVLLEFTLVNLFLGRLLASKAASKMETSMSDTSKLGTFPLLSVPESESSTTIKMATKPIRDWEACAKRVDSVAKILFPSCFALFIIIFISIYHIS